MIDVNSKELPQGWCWGLLNDLGRIISGGTPSTKVDNYWGDEIAWVSPADLSGYTQKFISRGRKSLSRLGLENSSACLMPTGTVLFSSRAPIGYVAIASNPISTNQGFKSLVPSKEIFNEYIYYYFKSAKQLAEEYASGTTFKEISSKSFAHLPIPIPPLSEQHRIVEKIEELFSDLDKGIESLKTTQQQLKIYRQAVLKWAFEGKLTAKWREEKKHKGELKSAEELLEQIKAEREKRDRTQLQEWHEAVKTWEANGRQGKKPAKPKKAKELLSLTENEIAELPKLPDKWRWVRLNSLALLITDGDHNPPKRIAEGIPHLTAKNVVNQKLNEIGCTFISHADYEKVRKRYSPQENDVVLTCVGTLGRTAIVLNNYKFSADRNLAVIRLLPNKILPKFLEYYLNTSLMQKTIHSASGSTAQPHLYLGDIREFKIPVVSVQEQNQIVEEIEFRLSICDRLEATITENLQRAEALRQSILKQAFEGKLVPQDPNDEPAEKLLERIRQEKLNGKNGQQLELEVFVNREKK